MPKLPSVVSQLPRDLKQFVERVREALNGEGWDRFVTARELRNAGVIEGSASGTNLTAGGGESYCGTPPAPTGLQANGALANIILTWDGLSFPCYAYTEIWAADSNDLGLAGIVGTTSGTIFAHSIGGSATRYYWIRYVNTQDVKGPYNAVAGTAGTTGTSPDYLLGVLAGEITESELATALNTRIDLIDTSGTGLVDRTGLLEGWRTSTDPRIDLLDTPGTGLVDRTGLLEGWQTATVPRLNLIDEAGTGLVDRTTLLEGWQTATVPRLDLIDADGTGLVDRMLEAEGELYLTGERLKGETKTRLANLQEDAEAILRNTMAQHDALVRNQGDLVIARSELQKKLNEGISAEASARLELAAQIGQTAATLISEQTVRASADEAMAEDITQLVADLGAANATIVADRLVRVTEDSALASATTALSASVGEATALIYAEQTARVSAVDAVVATVDGMVASIGENTASILEERSARATEDSAAAAAVTSLSASVGATNALIVTEQTVRAAADYALSQQITLINAGATEMFDWVNLWLFDEDAEGWLGGSVVNTGWLRPADGTGTYVYSPTLTGDDIIDGTRASQLRLRVRRAGTPPTWAGTLYWKETGDSTWAHSQSIDEPTFTDNIGLSTLNVDWDNIIQVRIDLSGTSSSTNYYELDWVAIGSPSPGVSTAQFTQEITALSDGISNEVDLRESLAATILGADGTANSSGLIYTEKNTRVMEDSATASVNSLLSATIKTDKADSDAKIVTTQQTMATEDSALAATGTALAASLETARATSDAKVLSEQQARVTEDSAVATAVTELSATLKTDKAEIAALVYAEEAARVEADNANARSAKLLGVASSENAEASLRALLQGDINFRDIAGTAAVIRTEMQTKINEGISAEATSRLALEAKVDDDIAGLYQEQLARADADGALAADILVLSGEVDGANANLLEEKAIRVTEDSATAASALYMAAELATADSTLSATVQSESAARVTEDSALSAAATQLAASVVTAESTLNAKVLEEKQARVEDGSALAATVSELSASVRTDVSEVAALVYGEESARVEADNANARTAKLLGAASGADAETTLRALLQGDINFRDVSGTAAFIRSEMQTKINDGISAEATARLALEAKVDDNTAAIYNEQIARVDADGVLASDLFILTGELEDAEDRLTADLIEERAIRVTEDSALAASVTQLSSTVGAHTTTLEVNAESINGIKGVYTVKIDNNGQVSGYGLVSELMDDGTVFSDFLLNVDRFAVVSPTVSNLPSRAINTTYAQGTRVNIDDARYARCEIGGVSGSSGITWPVIGDTVSDGDVLWRVSSKVPFAVLTNPLTVGNYSLPAGVYIDGANIVPGTIGNAQIASLSVDDAKIASLSAAKVTFGEMSGDRISVGSLNADRITTNTLSAQLAQITTAYVDTAHIKDAAITSAKIGDYIASTNFDGSVSADGDSYDTNSNGTTGWMINKNGYAVLNNARVRGAVYATSGEFSGSLNAATGSFVGTLNAGSVVGGTISGTTITGGVIEGATIVTSLQLRNTLAGGLFYTRYASVEYGGAVSLQWNYNDGKDGALNHYSCYSQNLTPYAYNALPNGTSYIDRYYSGAVAITLSGSFSIAGRIESVGPEGTILVKLQRADTGADLMTVLAWDFRAGATYTSNGITATMTEGATTITGTLSYSHSSAVYPLRVYLYIDTWRGTYTVQNPGSFTVTSHNHTFTS